MIFRDEFDGDTLDPVWRTAQYWDREYTVVGGGELQAYDASAVWTADPKHEPFKDVLKTSLWDGYRCSLGQASAAVLADFVVVQMVASVCADQATPEEAAQEAERRAKRYYKS